MKYLIRGSYTPEGLRGLLKEGGSGRREHFALMVKTLGGTVEAFYYTLGDDDLVAIVDLPTKTDVVTLTMAISAGGAFVAKTTVLITPEEIDAAVKKDIGYRPPGA
jgi:uncharacterized protein with GYD domain